MVMIILINPGVKFHLLLILKCISRAPPNGVTFVQMMLGDFNLPKFPHQNDLNELLPADGGREEKLQQRLVNNFMPQGAERCKSGENLQVVIAFNRRKSGGKKCLNRANTGLRVREMCSDSTRRVTDGNVSNVNLFYKAVSF